MDEEEDSVMVDSRETPREEREMPRSNWKPRILFVGLNPSILRRIPCENAGYEVVTAVGGKEALALLDRTVVDVIVAEMYMSDMDGYSLLRQIDSLAKISLIPVLLLPNRPSADNVPFDYFRWNHNFPIRWALGQPVNPQLLMNVLAKILRPDDRAVKSAEKWARYLVETEQAAS